jgi:23S rRNA (adenine2503-C2)-methyltransferase
MPINEQNTLKVLAESLKYYFAKTKNPVTYEYIIFNDFNDGIEDAIDLAKFCKHVPCKVNIIEYNPISFASYTNADEDKVEAFANYLKKQGINTNLRRSRGKDIDAACGQLAVKETT